MSGTTTWAVFVDGRVRFRTMADDKTPNEDALTWFGRPMTKMEFLHHHATLQDDYLAFAGRRPSFDETASVLSKQWSSYDLLKELIAAPEFVNSPAWKLKAPQYIEIYQRTFGEDGPPPTDVIGYAILHSLKERDFTSYLMSLPAWAESRAFRLAYSHLATMFARIYNSGAHDE